MPRPWTAVAAPDNPDTVESQSPLDVTLSLNPIAAGLLEALARDQSVSVSELVTRMVSEAIDSKIEREIASRLQERPALRVLPESAGGAAGA